MNTQETKCKNNNWLQLFVALLVSSSNSAYAEESLDYIAEHLLEVPMDFRYSSLPQVPLDDKDPEWRVQGGLGSEAGGLMHADVATLSLQYYQPINRDSGFTFSVFYDPFRISGDNGPAVVEPSFATLTNSPQRINASVTSIEGNGFHVGVSGSYLFLRDNGASWQIGALLETIKAQKFVIQFDSVGLASNYSGELNYTSTYNALTPYVNYEFAPNNLAFGFVGNLKATFAWPLPRVGFKGSISGPGFELSGDTDKAGNGTHIPDIFFGLGYSIEHPSTGWRFDVGTLAYLYVVEPRAHDQIDPPIFLSIAKAF